MTRAVAPTLTAVSGRTRTTRTRATLVLAASRRHVVDVCVEEADLLVLPQEGDAFAPSRRYHVASSPTWAHPVVTGEGVLVKDRDSLAFLRF